MFGFGCKSKRNLDKKEIDITSPITNADLLSKFNTFTVNRTENNMLKLGKAINQSNFLVPIITDELQTTDKLGNNTTIKKGSTIKILNCFNDLNDCFLPLFSDWDQVQKWTNEEVSSIVMPAGQAWEFILSNNTYSGAIINPGSIGWTMSRENIEQLNFEL